MSKPKKPSKTEEGPTRSKRPRRVPAAHPAEAPASLRAYVVIDPEKCVACGACAAVCPEEAISVDESATVDTSRCNGCGECLTACPAEAISSTGRG